MLLLLKKRWKIIVILIWAYMALLGIVYYFKIGVDNRNFSNNILYCILYLMICRLIEKSIEKASKKNFLFSLIFSIFAAGILVLGAQVEYLEKAFWSFSMFLRVLFLSTFFVPVFNYCFFAEKVISCFFNCSGKESQ